MKRGMVMGCILLLCSFSACSLHDTEEEKTSEYSYAALEEMEELTPEEDTIKVVLYENQALPYRWKANIQGDALEPVSEETVSGKGSLFQSGDSPAYHVFVFRWVTDGEVQLEAVNARISPPDDTEWSEARAWLVKKQDGNVTWEPLGENQ